MVTIGQRKENAWVTFTFIPNGAVEEVVLMGNWDDWEEHRMKPKKDGTFYIRKSIACHKEYQFGYKIDGTRWQSDESLSVVPSPFGGYNSLLNLE